MLDEIDSGLDIDAMRDVASAVNGLKRPDSATLMVTHYKVRMSWCQELCDAALQQRAPSTCGQPCVMGQVGMHVLWCTGMCCSVLCNVPCTCRVSSKHALVISARWVDCACEALTPMRVPHIPCMRAALGIWIAAAASFIAQSARAISTCII